MPGRTTPLVFRLFLTCGVSLGAILLAPRSATAGGAGTDYQVSPSPAWVSLRYRQLATEEATRLVPGWTSFLHGEGREWLVAQYRDDLGAPAGLMGPGIPILPPDGDAAALREAAGRFLARHAAMLGTDPGQLGPPETISLPRCIALFYQQTWNGLDVVGGRLELYVAGGRLFFIGTELFPRVSAEDAAILTLEQARIAATAGMPFDASTDQFVGVPRLVVCPLAGDSAPTFRLAYEVRFVTADPAGDWWTYVGASDGRILARENQAAFFGIPVTVRSDVQLEHHDDPYVERPGAHEYVWVGNDRGITDSTGFVVLPAPLLRDYTVSSELRGPFCNVNRLDGPDANWTGIGYPDDSLLIKWDDSNSLPVERDCFYTIVRTHDWIKGVDSGFLDLDWEVPCNVNLTTGSCNAYWNGASLNFYKEGGGCSNMGQAADIVIHEYAHAITQYTYYPQAPPGSSGMNDVFSDVVAMTITNDPCIGERVSSPGCLRDGRNLRQYPGTECAGEIHCLAEILMGALWKTRANLIDSYGYGSVHGIFDPLFRATWKTEPYSMPDFLVRLLINDDDNANVADGTPHWPEICAAFQAHNIPCPEISQYVWFDHTPLPDQEYEGSSVEVVSRIYAVNGGSLVPDSLRLCYRTDQGAGWTSTPLTATGNPDEYHGYIAVPACGYLVDYYLRATTTTGTWATEPARAPGHGTHRFMDGFLSTTLNDDAEIDRGWTLGAMGDMATEGIWERTDPVGKVSPPGEWVQPEEDHTPAPGSLCWVTDGRGGSYTAYDVDGGATTFVSPLLNWSAGVASAVGKIEFWAFFANLFAVDDTLRASVSNNGGSTWKDLVKIYGDQSNGWMHYTAYVTSSELPFTDQMRFRFQVADYSSSCTEAAVDDVRISLAQCLYYPPGACCLSDGSCQMTSEYTCPGDWLSWESICDPNPCPNSGVGGSEAKWVFRLESAQPNPFGDATTIRFSVPAREQARVEVYDSSGRLVRRLFSGPAGVGTHRLTWDGRSDQDLPVPSGVYFCRLTGEGRSSQRTVVRIQ